MNLEQHTRAREIAAAALALDPWEREDFLRRRTADDPQVRHEVLRRLDRAREVPDGFLDQPAVDLLSGDGSGGPAADGLPAASPLDLGEIRVAGDRRFRLLEIRGAGGTATIYRATDLRLDREVALKHLHQAMVGDPKAVRRFCREARAAARLNHPAIVRVFEVLDDRNGVPPSGVWIVMELVPGHSLSRRLAAGPLELGEALVLAADIAAGLAVAHAAGIVHRDLKAANVMVTPDGRGRPARASAEGGVSAGRASAGGATAGHAKILDFGLAKTLASGEESLTDEHEIFGTPHALSPEQVYRTEVDERSDLFSFGSLLYQMVTGEAPFRGPSTLLTLQRVCVFRPPPAREVNPGVPPHLSSLIEGLMEKDPDDRPQQTAEVARELARLAGRT